MSEDVNEGEKNESFSYLKNTHFDQKQRAVDGVNGLIMELESHCNNVLFSSFSWSKTEANGEFCREKSEIDLTKIAAGIGIPPARCQFP